MRLSAIYAALHVQGVQRVELIKPLTDMVLDKTQASSAPILKQKLVALMTSSLLPPGSSALERRLAQACSGISDLNVPLRDLWNPWKCPAKFLPYLALAFSVDRWEETWTETAKRQAVSDAFWIHQRKGTVAAVKRVIEGLGIR